MKIQLKRSNVLDGGIAKEPTPAQMEYGEIAVNYNNTDPALFIKDSSDAIVKVSLDSVSTGLQPGDNVSELNNDAGYITAGDVPSAPVDSVNNKTGIVVLTASDVGAATAAQGTKADTAVQPGDDISDLNNDAGYITVADIPASGVESVNSKTGVVVLTAADVGAATTAQGAKADSALQSGDNISELNNNAGYITAGDVPSAPVNSVNAKTGTVVLNAADVGAATTAQGTKADSALQPGDDVSDLNNDAGYITLAEVPPGGVTSVNTQTGDVVLSYGDVDAMPLDLAVLPELV
jgi:hypothetical protein